MNWLIKVVMMFWEYPDEQPKKPDIIVPLGYGPHICLSLAPLKKAKEIAGQFTNSKVVFASAGYFGPGCAEQETVLKLNFFWEQEGITKNRIFWVKKGISNTVEEAIEIRKLFPLAKEVVVIADWMHSRSAKKIWKKIFPKSKIKMQSVRLKYTKKQPILALHSAEKWLIANLLRHLLFSILGEKISKIHHPIKKS